MSLPQVGGFISQSFFHVCYLLIHPLCALSAFESLDCSQAVVLRDLKRDLVGLGAKSVFWGHYSSKKDLVSISLKSAACMCSGRSPEWNACCTVSRRGAASRPEDHTWWANHVLHHCALESPLDGPSEAEGKADPRP